MQTISRQSMHRHFTLEESINMSSLQGKTAIVTGGGSGIGRATCSSLAGAGAEVAVWDVSIENANATVEQIVTLGGKAFSVCGSVSESIQVVRCLDEIDARWKKIDILVNNAGVSGNRPTLDLSDDEWRRAISINLDGVFYCSREVGRRMKETGGGRIVNLGSIYSVVAAPNRLSYCASKAGVAMLTKSLAIEWACLGINVNCVAPGYVDTPLLNELWADGRINRPALEGRTPQKRLALPEEIADAIVYFCELRSAHITGQVLCVDGGWTAYGYL
jgi:NAD(P)-dependent dehydrogenase (short-subunit alcohol dehydrogenase family)